MVLCSILPPQAEQAKWAFSFLAPPRFEVETRYQYLKDKTQIRKIGILHDPSPYATLQKDIAVKIAGDFGIEVPVVEQYKPDDADYSAQISKMVAAGAKAILKIGLGGSTLTTAKNIKQLGQDILLLGSIDDFAVLKPAAETLGEQFMFVAAPSQVYDVLPAGPLKEEIGRFLPLWRAKQGDRDAFWAGKAWDALMVVKAAAEKGKSLEGPKMRDAIETIERFPGHGRRLQFLADRASGHHAKPVLPRHHRRRKAPGEMMAQAAVHASAEAGVQPKILDVENLSARYGQVEALHGVSISVRAGELVAVLGPNGAGKSTLLRSVMGLTTSTGSVRFGDQSLPRRGTSKIARAGVVLVPEGRGIFAPMSVAENLQLGAYMIGGRGAEFERRREQVLALFPRLKERLDQVSGSMSGGEQQMLAVGRALMARAAPSPARRAVARPRTEGDGGNSGDARTAQPRRSADPSGGAESAAGAQARQSRAMSCRTAASRRKSTLVRSTPMPTSRNSTSISFGRASCRGCRLRLPWRWSPMPIVAGGYIVTVVGFALIYAVFVTGLNIFMGYAGQASFGQNAFAAIGGYTSAVLTATYGWPPVPAMLAGIAGADRLRGRWSAIRPCG